MNIKFLSIAFIIGIVIGGAAGMFTYTLFHKSPEIKTGTNTIVKIIRDTIKVDKTIAGGIHANTRYVPTQPQTGPSWFSPCSGKDSASGNSNSDNLGIETVSYGDTNTINGVGVHVEYWHRADNFKYKFNYPERTISDSVLSSTVTNNIQTIRELPRWELGIGGSMRMYNSQLNYTVFPVLDYNAKILFFYLTLEGKGDITLRSGGVSLDPSLEAKLKIGL